MAEYKFDDLTPDNFIERLKNELADPKTPIDKTKWCNDLKYRTSLLKGDSENRKKGILCQVFSQFGYQYSNLKKTKEIVAEKIQKLILFESERKDITLFTGFCENHYASYHNGRYQYDVVLELENDLHEFQMTVRGLFDIRASLYIGIFYVDKNVSTIDKINRSDLGDITPGFFKDWSPRCLFECNKETTPLFHEKDELLIIFLSEDTPEIKFSKPFPLGNHAGALINKESMTMTRDKD